MELACFVCCCSLGSGAVNYRYNGNDKNNRVCVTCWEEYAADCAHLLEPGEYTMMRGESEEVNS